MTFENVEIVNYRGYAIFGINLLGISVFEHLTIHRSYSNNLGQRNLLKSDSLAQSGSGMTVYYVDYEHQEENFTAVDNTTFTSLASKVDHFVYIQSSVFANNTNLYPDDLVNIDNFRSFKRDNDNELPLAGAGGVSIFTLQLLFNVQIDVLNSSITDNSESTGGGVKILHRNTIKHSLITLQGCFICNNTLLNSFSRGAGLQIFFAFSFVRLNQLAQLSNSLQEEHDVLVKDTVFVNHTAPNEVAALISSSPQNISVVVITFCNVTIRGGESSDCIFVRNDRSVYFSESLLYLSLDQIHIDQSSELSSSAFGAATFSNLGAVYIKGTNDNPSVFEEGQNGAIKAYNTDIHLFGTVIFRNNKGLLGAALFLQDSSALFLNEKLNALFSNNKATGNGGAIYIEPSRSKQCAVQIVTNEKLFDTNNIVTFQENLTQFDLSVTFIDNEAAIGQSLYGGPIYNCSGLPDSIIQLPKNKVNAVYNALFTFMQNNQRVSYLDEFRSSAVKLCFCEQSGNNFECVSTPNPEVLPGVVFMLYVSPVDSISLPVDGVMVAMLSLDSGARFSSGGANSHQVFDRGICEEIPYTLVGIENATVILDLKLESVLSSSLTISTSINILPCPPGFALSNATGTCVCNSLYQHFDVTCNITTGLIRRPRNEWIGIVTDGTTDLAAIVRTCPYGYCIFDFDTDLNISDPTAICQGGRTGPLCGVCDDGLSVMFGTTDCGECSNNYLFTIFMYAIAGILLVLALFDITISGGTINGLVIYAQLMGSSLTIVGNSNAQFTTIFISLLNLNLGFPLCFYDGMDELTSNGLQFVFPVYLWLLVAVLTVATHFSSRLQKLFDNNMCLKVLVTLVYLSFAKIIRTITLILLPALVETEDNDLHFVWFFDGSVKYFNNGWHIFLVLLSVLFGILTLLYQCTLLITLFCGLRAGRLNAYLKPIIDVHTAPFKDKWRFWIGFRLVFVEVFTILTLSLSGKFFSLSLFLHFVLIFLLTILFKLLWLP